MIKVAPYGVLIGMGGAIAIGVLLVAVQAHRDPLVQVAAAAETNQGLLSLLALGAAFWIALFEHLRANAAEDKRRRDFVAMLCGLIREAEEFAACEVPASETEVERLADEWDDLVHRAGIAVNETKVAAAPDAKLILLAVALQAAFFEAKVGRPTAAVLRRKLDEASARLRALKLEIRQRARL